MVVERHGVGRGGGGHELTIAGALADAGGVVGCDGLAEEEGGEEGGELCELGSAISLV